MLNSVVKMSMMSAKCFEYYTIILRGGGVFSWTHSTLQWIKLIIFCFWEDVKHVQYAKELLYCYTGFDRNYNNIRYKHCDFTQKAYKPLPVFYWPEQLLFARTRRLHRLLCLHYTYTY